MSVEIYDPQFTQPQRVSYTIKTSSAKDAAKLVKTFDLMKDLKSPFAANVISRAYIGDEFKFNSTDAPFSMNTELFFEKLLKHSTIKQDEKDSIRYNLIKKSKEVNGDIQKTYLDIKV